MTAELTPDLVLRRLAEAATPGPWVSGDPRFGLGNAQCIVSISERAMGRDIQGPTLRPAQFDVEYIAAANPAVVLALLDAAAFLDEVRGQVARGALCPMCSTGMTRQTVGMVCQLCGADYARPEQTSKVVLAEALAVRAECDALAIENARLREGGCGDGWH